MFDAFQQQFQPVIDAHINLSHPFLTNLPAKPPHNFPPISSAELCEALLTCSNSSVPGPSHMSWGFLKLLLTDSNFQEQFLLLANDIISSGTWPSAFKDSTMVVIPKPHKDDYMQVKNFWPIALLECTGKLISKPLAAWLQSEVVHFSLIHPLQFSGLKYHSTIDAGFFLTEYVTKARNAGHFSSALALDVVQFFPSLCKEVIIFMLQKLGFSPALCHLLSSYYDEWSTKYLWNVFFSKDYDTNKGVP